MAPARNPNVFIDLWWLALVAALTPLLTIHTTLLVSISEGHISPCMPYLESCTSISRTGRHGLSYFIFKGTMLPAAVLGILFWLLNGRWLRQLGVTTGGTAWLAGLGLVAGLSLAAYTLALGHGGDGFNLVRRVGVVLYFSLTFIAQLLLSAGLRSQPAWRQTGQRLLNLCQVTLGVGMLSVIVSAIDYAFYSQWDDAVEWVLALLINSHAVWVALLWRRSHFRARLWTG